MVIVTDTDFYIAVGVLGIVLLITILVVIVLFAYVLSIHKQLKQRQQGVSEKYEDYKKGTAQVRNTPNSDNSRFPVPNMYGEDPAAENRVNKNPLANKNINNFERNSAVINEIRRELKQANHRQPPTPPPKPETPSWPTTPARYPLRPPTSQVQNTENKNFFY